MRRTAGWMLGVMVVAMTAVLMGAPAVLACGGLQPKLTQWQVGIDNWFLDPNWDLGVPRDIDTARVDNGGTAEIRAAGACAKVLQIGYSLDELNSGVHLYDGGTLCVGKAEYIGLGGAGSFVQEGGWHQVTCGCLTMGKDEGSAGAYYLTAGELVVKCGTVIAENGQASFFQDGGSHVIPNGSLKLAVCAGSQAAYVLTGGLLSLSRDLWLGMEGWAAFDQLGGTNSFPCGTLYVATGSGSSAAYSLQGGRLLTSRVVLGGKGTGAMDQSDGMMAVKHAFIAGRDESGTGSLVLQGGQMSVGGNETWGLDGLGVLYQAGGSHAVACEFRVGDNTGSGGIVDLVGGSLSANRIEIGWERGSGVLGIYGLEPLVTASNAFALGANALLSATEAAVHLTAAGADFYNTSVDPIALEGLEYLDAIFEGGVSCAWGTFEVAGLDEGGTAAGFVENFVLGALVVGESKPARVQLKDAFDNGRRAGGNEALYVHEVVVTAGSTLDLRGLNVYCDGPLDVQGTVIHGTITQVTI